MLIKEPRTTEKDKELAMWIDECWREMKEEERKVWLWIEDFWNNSEEMIWKL